MELSNEVRAGDAGAASGAGAKAGLYIERRNVVEVELTEVETDEDEVEAGTSERSRTRRFFSGGDRVDETGPEGEESEASKEGDGNVAEEVEGRIGD